MALPIFSSVDDLQALIANGATESNTLEFKESLPGGTREERIEFPADVSSFANASGGLIIYGMREENGIASEIVGINDAEIDDAKLRLESMLRDGIDPRIHGIDIPPVSLGDGNSIIIIKIPKSFNSPHVVNSQGHWRFYSRNSAGKFQIDVDEVRIAFSASEELPERIRNFRAERLLKIEAGDLPVAIQNTAKIVLHLIPISSFAAQRNYDVVSLMNNTDAIYLRLQPICGTITNRRLNLDGLLTFMKSREDLPAEGYVQVFRDGTIEAVDTALLNPEINNGLIIPSVAYEEKLRVAIPRYFNILNLLGVETPIVLMLSLLGVNEYIMGVGRGSIIIGSQPQTIDRDNLILPETIAETFEEDVDVLMQSTFDAIWNAAGYARSTNYDENGNWIR